MKKIIKDEYRGNSFEGDMYMLTIPNLYKLKKTTLNEFYMQNYLP